MKKSILFLLLFILTFSSYVYGNTQSQALVAQGRTAFFNNGFPTCTGIIEANGYFQSAVDEDADDQVAQLFYAVTRLAVSGLEQGSGTELQTVRDILSAFGIYRNSNNNFMDGPIYTDPPEYGGVYLPPETIPDGTELHQFNNTQLLVLLTAVLDNLSLVSDDTINITLTAIETGDISVEVDWGDVLLFKNAVKILKGLILTITAYNISGIDTAKLIQLGQADIFQIQRDLLDIYPDALKLMSGGAGAATLTEAKTILISAIEDFDSAITFITSESDNQMDDLLSFNEEDMNEINLMIASFNEAKNSIEEDRNAVFDFEQQGWHITDEFGRSFNLYFNTDMGVIDHESLNSYFNYQNGDGTNPGYPFNIEGGYVSFLEIDNNIINIEIDYWNQECGMAHITFQGTLNFQKDTIVSGTWVQNECGNSYSGNFTGTRTYIDEEADEINFNALFGSSTKTPLDIRQVMPDFNILNHPIAGTFPEYPNSGDPVLNGINPSEYITNYDTTLEMYLQPQGAVTIPELTITLDGSDSDWPESALVFTDITNEDPNWSQSMDIEKAYLAKDSQYLYVAMKFANGTPPTPTYEWEQINYNLNLRTFPGDNHERQLNISAGYDFQTTSWQVKVAEFQDGIWQERESYSTNALAIGINLIEFRVPLSVINYRVNGLNGKFLTFKTAYRSYRFYDFDYWSGDSNKTLLQIDPSLNINGSVLTDSGNPGSVIIKLRSDPENVFMANTHTNGTGVFTLPNIPSTDKGLILTAFQDIDGNGIQTFGEPWETYMLSMLTSDFTWNPDLTSLPDSDGDGIPDLIEITACTDVYDADTDDDGILDGVEDKNQNGIVEEDETDPCNPDTDGDGIQDCTELGLTLSDVGADTDLSIFQPDFDSSSTTDPLLPDSDGDGYSDGDEDKNHNGRVDTGESNPDDATSKPSGAMPWIPLLLLN
jgi:hypothetical protein